MKSDPGLREFLNLGSKVPKYGIQLMRALKVQQALQNFV